MIISYFSASFILLIITVFILILNLKLKKRTTNEKPYEKNIIFIQHLINKAFNNLARPYYLWMSLCLLVTLLFFNIFYKFSHFYLIVSVLTVYGFVFTLLMSHVTTKLYIYSIRKLSNHLFHSFNYLYSWSKQFGLIVLIFWTISSLFNLFLVEKLLLWIAGDTLFFTVQSFFNTLNINLLTSYENMKYFVYGILIIPFGFGSSIYSFLSHCIGLPKAVAGDMATDLIGHTEYDFHESDLRNPGLIYNFLGDFIKKIYCPTASIISTFILLKGFSFIFTSLYCSSFHLNPYHFFSGYLIILSASLFLYSILFISFNIVFTFSHKNMIKYQSIINSIYFLIKTLFVYILFKMINLDLPYQKPLYLGILGGACLYYVILYLINEKSIFTKILSKASSHGFVSILLKGFCFTFLISSIVAILYCVCLEFLFEFNTSSNELFSNLNVLIFLACELFITGIVIFPSALSNGLINFFSNISAMITDKKIDKDLYYLHSNGQTHILITNIILLWSIVLLCPPIIYNSLNLLSQISLKYQNVTSINSFANPSQLHQLSINYFNIHFLNPQFLIGMILGIVAIFIFGLYMLFNLNQYYRSLKNAIRSHLQENPSIFTHDMLPNYLNLIPRFSFNHGVKQFVFYIIFCLILQIIWFQIKFAGIYGFILSLTVTGFILSLFFLILGYLLSNTKHYTELNQNSTDSNTYINVFFSDKIGDFLKNILGTSILELIKFILLFYFYSFFLIFYIQTLNF